MAGVSVVLDRIAKSFGDAAPAVGGVSLQVAPGELLGLLGPAGSGKTMILRLIAGLTPASSGRVLVGGRDVTALPVHRRDMGIVFQEEALFPHLNVGDNVAFGLQVRRMKRDNVAWRVARALELVRLGGLARRRPRELADNQRQRVALARALVIEPSALLLDEPLANLDAGLRAELRTDIRDIQRRQDLTTVVMLADPEDALALCDRIAVLRAGRLEQIGTPRELYEQPRSPFVAEFVGRINRVEATREADGGIAVGSLRLRAAGPGAPGAVTILVRPHRIVLAGVAPGSEWNSCAGRVRRVTYVGDMLAFEVENDSLSLSVEQPTLTGMPTPREGETVGLAWRHADTLVFPRTAG